MRLLLEPERATTFAELVAAGSAASAEGLDGVLLRPSPEIPSPLVAAAALAAAVADILIAVEVPIGDRHPLEVAEEAAVVDLGSGGRLVLVVRPAPSAEGVFEEALDLLRTALAARPFRWPGPRWPTPANLPENVNNPEQRTRMMPPPFQPRLTIWGGVGVGPAAIARGLGHLAGEDEDGAALRDLWAGEGPAGLGAPRGRRERWRGVEPLVERLRAGRDQFGQDWAAVLASVGDVAELGREVRPRVQLDELPPGLEDHWESRRETD
jgi:alkanesulfonate monooxygenase SsuD/methylene tetrahydromethanopterin reductase-like flavin-dependent oxidoreductase (luciferase family)